MLEHTSEHAGRVAVVTGAGSGIGRGIAHRLQQEGARVNALDVSAPSSDTATDLPPGCAPITYYQVDASQEQAVEATLETIAARDGAMEYLVCCAAIFPWRPFLDVGIEEWQRTLAVNLTGSFLCCRAALRQMRARGFGRIVLFSSGLARSGGVNCAAYATSKGGVLGLARSAALEVASENIRVNTISPGLTDTPQPRGHLSEEALYAKGPTIPLGRIGRVEDIVEACLFLLSEDSSFVVGQDLRVNGGAPLW